jgi:hypothetical protein
MPRKTVLLTLVAALGLTVTAWAAAPGAQATGRAQAACKALQGTLGATTFTQAYGSFGGCVASLARVEQQNLDAAEAACTAEQSDANFAATHGGKTFAQFYGAGPLGKNAFRRCVAAKAHASSQAEGQSRPNPARLCSAQRTQMTAGPFASFYGKNANDRNAFGKCVSAMAKNEVQNELTAAAACRAEQADTGFAAAHAGKTFAQFYGTNDDLTNAFGKCVAAKAKAKTQAQQQATIAAVKTCAAERRADRAAFNAKYTTFRSCVKQHGG